MDFFIPKGRSEGSSGDETILKDLAKFAQATVPPPDNRIQSVVYQRGDEEWIVTVGEQLEGRVVDGSRARGYARLSNPATVLAIFPGENVWVVATNAYPLGTIAPTWANPFLIAPDEIKDVHRFDPA